MSKYHREVLWLDEFDEGIKRFFVDGVPNLILTNHAKHRIMDRGLITPTLEQIAGGYIFEVEITDNGIHKIVSRYKMNATRDIIVALMKDTNGYVVKSVWDCAHNDHHRTLRTEEYEQ
jgi:hypothetical protein